MIDGAQVFATAVIRALDSPTNSPAVVERDGVATSSSAFLHRATTFAEWTRRAGTDVRPIAGLVGYSADSLAFLVAASTTDTPLAPLGPRLPEHELAEVVRRLNSRFLVHDRAHTDIARSVAARAGVEAIDLSEIEDRGGDDALLRRAAPDDVALIIHTSGTTGAPKPVAYSQGTLHRRGVTLAGLVGMDRPGAVYATGAPIHHVGGIGNTLVALQFGATVAAMGDFSVDWWRSLADVGVTHTLLVPTMIEMLIRADVLPMPSLEVLIYGASPIREQTLRAALTALPGVEFVNLFGQTEGSPISCLVMDDHRRALAGQEHLLTSVGRAAPGTVVRIADQDDAGNGELLAAADHLATVSDDGWLHTGDIGHIDDDGYLYLVGRTHDRIIRGGENIYPSEVEDALARHPSVSDVGVTGVPDARLGETVMAFIVSADGDIDVDVLTAHARSLLAAFKVPARWHQVSTLPRTASGKLLRRRLTEQI